VNQLCDAALWDDPDGFFYDWLLAGRGTKSPLRATDRWWAIPLFAVTRWMRKASTSCTAFKRQHGLVHQNIGRTCAAILHLSRAAGVGERN